jgi:hypothetical protein
MSYDWWRGRMEFVVVGQEGVPTAATFDTDNSEIPGDSVIVDQQPHSPDTMDSSQLLLHMPNSSSTMPAVLGSLPVETMVMVLVVVFCAGLVFGLMISLHLSPRYNEDHDDNEDDSEEEEDEVREQFRRVIPPQRRTTAPAPRTMAPAPNDTNIKIRIVQAAINLRKKSPVQALELGRMLSQLQSQGLRDKRRVPLLRSYYPRVRGQSHAVAILDALVAHPHLLYVAVGPLLHRK